MRLPARHKLLHQSYEPFDCEYAQTGGPFRAPRCTPRAQNLINNKSIDAATAHCLVTHWQIDDPLLPNLVRRVDAGERIIDDEGFLQIEE